MGVTCYTAIASYTDEEREGSAPGAWKRLSKGLVMGRVGLGKAGGQRS